MDLLRGRWLDKVGLWERRLGQVRLWRRWLDKIRGRLPEDIQMQTRWPGRICGQWVPKNTSCRQLQLTKVLRFPMVFNEFVNRARWQDDVELWKKWPGEMKLWGRWLDKNPETASVQPLPDVSNGSSSGCIKLTISWMYEIIYSPDVWNCPFPGCGPFPGV